jgi:hypothetical protein
MKHFKHPATVIAALALFVALGGGAAWASGLINGSQIKNHSISTKKLTKKAIKQLHGARGARGPAGPAGATGATGPQGPAGATGAPGTARAYAYVTGGTSPTLDPARTKNFASVTQPTGLTGVYCLAPSAGTGLDPSTMPFTVSVDWGTSTTPSEAYYHPGFNCPTGQFEVITANPSGTRINGVNFTMIVP